MTSLANTPASKPSEPGALNQFVKSLVAAIRRHVVVVQEEPAKRFRDQLAELEQRFDGSRNLPALVDGASDALKNYAQQANQIVEQQRSEFNMVISELTTALASIPDVSHYSQRFDAIEKQLASLSSSGDMLQAQDRIKECVTLARDESISQRQRISDMISAVISCVRTKHQESEVVEPKPASGALYVPDPLTGLPGRAYAETELARIHAQFPQCPAAIFIVRRLNLINSRFGFSRGDQVLLRVVQHLAQAMPECNALFRWTPCAFLIITPPSLEYQELRRRVQQIQQQRLTVTLEWDGRTALVPVGLDTLVTRLGDYASPDELSHAMDARVTDE